MQPEGRPECSPGLKAFLSLPQPGPWSKQGSENEATSPRTRRDGSHQSNQRLLGIKDGLGRVRVCVHARVCVCVCVYGSWPISEGLGICAVLGWTEQSSFCGEVTFPGIMPPQPIPCSLEGTSSVIRRALCPFNSLLYSGAFDK